MLCSCFVKAQVATDTRIEMTKTEICRAWSCNGQQTPNVSTKTKQQTREFAVAVDLWHHYLHQYSANWMKLVEICQLLFLALGTAVIGSANERGELALPLRQGCQQTIARCTIFQLLVARWPLFVLFEVFLPQVCPLL